MTQLIEHINEWNQPQLFSLCVTVLICFIIGITVFIMCKKSDPTKAPNGFLIAMEGYLNFFETTFDEATEGKISKTRIYLFVLGTFLLIGNLVGIIGLEPIATSYSIPFTLALITWLGIYVVGFIYQKFSFFKKYLNPLEFLSQFVPLISLSFRIFGNIIAGSTIVFLVYYLFGRAWLVFPLEDNMPWFFFFGPVANSVLHLYFDIFGAFIQALVFTSLTLIYWVNEAETKAKKEKKIKTRNTKQVIY